MAAKVVPELGVAALWTETKPPATAATATTAAHPTVMAALNQRDDAQSKTTVGPGGVQLLCGGGYLWAGGGVAGVAGEPVRAVLGFMTD